MPEDRSIQRTFLTACKRVLTVCSKPFSSDGVRVIGYHSISQGRSPLCVTPEDFEYQLDYLARKGFTTLSINEYCNRLTGQERSRNEVLITFDDGYVDFIDNALPLLKKHACRATVFVAANLVGTRPTWIERDRELIVKVLDTVGFSESEKREVLEWNESFAHAPLMDWHQLRSIHQQGIDVQSHSRDHRFLTSLSADQLYEDLANSRQTLEAELSTPVRAIAYPYGDCNARVASAANRAGYDIGFLSLPTMMSDRLQIGRTQIGGENIRANYRYALSAARGYEAWIRRALHNIRRQDAT